MRSRISFILLGFAAIPVIAAPIRSLAQCSGGAEIWGNDQIITLVHSNTDLALDFSFFAHGPVLYAIWNESGSVPVMHNAGDFKWITTARFAGTFLHELGHSLGLHHGGAVVPAQGPEALFVTSDNGRLYKIDVQTGVGIANVDVRRAFCMNDKLIAPPAVQLYSASNAAFQGAMLAARGRPDDLVFVVTRHGCGDHDGNQVIAYYASDLTERWRFNSTGSFSMDYAKDGCEVHSGSNVLYCGTNQASPLQSTLWAIETISGGLVWSQNAGSIQNRPTVHPEPKDLYIASTDGVIQKRDAAGGAL